MLLMFALGISSCNNHNGWNHEQRKSIREPLRTYRKMVYLNDLTDVEYDRFADEVAGLIEKEYPVYTSFIEMDGATDTVYMMIVETIVQELNEDARNMRHIYPYNFLIKQGVLPEGLTREQQHQFYKCFAGKVNSNFTMSEFVNAVLNDSADNSLIRKLASQCVNDLFNWVVTEIDVVETTDRPQLQ